MGKIVLCLELDAVDLHGFAALREGLAHRGIRFRSLEEERACHPEIWLARFAQMDNATRTSDRFAPRTPEEIGLRVADFGPEPVGCIVADEGERLIGYTYFHKASGEDPYRARQGWTGVVPEYRRQGVATVLKLEGILLARQLGFHRMVTDPNEDNAASVRMSKRVGFIVCDSDAGVLPI
jgi:RimJ/RimL family protein N-acetyltransferase